MSINYNKVKHEIHFNIRHSQMDGGDGHNLCNKKRFQFLSINRIENNMH